MVTEPTPFSPSPSGSAAADAARGQGYWYGAWCDLAVTAGRLLASPRHDSADAALAASAHAALLDTTLLVLHEAAGLPGRPSRSLPAAPGGSEQGATRGVTMAHVANQPVWALGMSLAAQPRARVVSVSDALAVPNRSPGDAAWMDLFRAAVVAGGEWHQSLEVRTRRLDRLGTTAGGGSAGRWGVLADVAALAEAAARLSGDLATILDRGDDAVQRLQPVQRRHLEALRAALPRQDRRVRHGQPSAADELLAVAQRVSRMAGSADVLPPGSLTPMTHARIPVLVRQPGDVDAALWRLGDLIEDARSLSPATVGHLVTAQHQLAVDAARLGRVGGLHDLLTQQRLAHARLHAALRPLITASPGTDRPLHQCRELLHYTRSLRPGSAEGHSVAVAVLSHGPRLARLTRRRVLTELGAPRWTSKAAALDTIVGTADAAPLSTSSMLTQLRTWVRVARDLRERAPRRSPEAEGVRSLGYRHLTAALDGREARPHHPADPIRTADPIPGRGRAGKVPAAAGMGLG